jgi:hypothetical protein
MICGEPSVSEMTSKTALQLSISEDVDGKTASHLACAPLTEMNQAIQRIAV